MHLIFLGLPPFSFLLRSDRCRCRCRSQLGLQNDSAYSLFVLEDTLFQALQDDVVFEEEQRRNRTRRSALLS